MTAVKPPAGGNGGIGMQVAPLRALIALMLAVLSLTTGGCAQLKGPEAPSALRPIATSAPAGALQEVAPPGAVLQVLDRLNERTPRVAITAPADDALVAEGPWLLQLQVSDWPMASGSEAVEGPHVVVQVDQQPPQRLGGDAIAQPITMPALSPGSHRLTVYAARPWGEAVKSPGAVQQIRLHRVGRNAAELPERGSPQLIVASPDGQPQQEPVLIDWLLLDAPLQNLRNDDARWRLRVSVNGDSFLVDRQTPLWLKGFRRGSNAVQLELLDGRGDALNPPFNSVVREVVLGTANRPAWQNANLSAGALAVLSGEASPAATEPDTSRETARDSSNASAAHPDPEANPAPEPEPEPEPEPIAKAVDADASATADPAPQPLATQSTAKAESDDKPQSAASAFEASTSPEAQETNAAAEPLRSPTAEGSEPVQEPAEPVLETPPFETAPFGTAPSDAADIASAEPTPTPAHAPAQAEPATTPPADRLRASTSLSGSARDQLNADGSLLQPQRRGPLAGLREKLGG